MNHLSTFQIIVFGLSIFFLILGVGIFAAFGGLLGGSSVGPVTVWGTMDASVMSNLLATLRQSDKTFENVQYIQKDPATYDTNLVSAMAAGTGPDLFLVSQDTVSSFADKIKAIPYGSYSQAQFTGSFIDEGQLFLTNTGALALPFSIDPLVMYYNRDLFAAAGLAQAPKYWNDFLTIAPKITSLDTNSNVQKSAVALGVWPNIDHAKDILSTLFMQAGDPIIVRGSDGSLVPVFGQTPVNAPANPAESALRFYTEFADPSKTTYSWNASLPEASIAFTSGDVAVYFGFASEYPSLAARNPNLHFSAALLPQLQGNSSQLTFGELTSVAISRTAHNPAGALAVAEKLTGQQAILLLTQAEGLPPVRRDVIVDTSSSAALQVFVQSSLLSKAWLDPAPAQTNAIFKTMIESVISGAEQPAGAVSLGAQSLAQISH
ncbi:MAG: extracellular solute-binding protein [Patescibacteria group bacterium]|nr:extracellular solute-binding protein [Patescibacteria group bacterium]